VKRLQWIDPEIRGIDALPVGWGNCKAGSTKQSNLCANGQVTGGAGHLCAVGGAPV